MKYLISLMIILSLPKTCNRQLKDNPSNLIIDKKAILTPIEIGCLDYSKLSVELSINSLEDYEMLKAHKLSYSNCQEYELPEINFETTTLIGLKTTAYGCMEPSYTRELIYDSDKGAYTYTVNIIQDGACEKAWFGINWVAVNKLEKGAVINFNTVKK